MGIYYNKELKTKEQKDRWNYILDHRFESMELYYRNVLSMSRLLSIFRRVFKVAPITIKNAKEDNKYYSKKLFAIFLLTKYSKSLTEDIAKEFHISSDIVANIAIDSIYKEDLIEDSKLFFKGFEVEYLEQIKSELLFKEFLSESSH